MVDQSSPDLGAAESADPVPRVALMLEQDVARHVADGKTLDFRGLITAALSRLVAESAQYLDVAAVVEVTERLYDQHIAPLDIPGIPNIIEPRVDAAIRKQIRPIIYHMFESVKS